MGIKLVLSLGYADAPLAAGGTREVRWPIASITNVADLLLIASLA